jgi:fucose 4-O-acetylase-like acetyltransferase
MERLVRKKIRVEEIDMLKALGIILMVAAHAGAPFGKFVNLFHMAVFFMASGFFYNESSSDTVDSVCMVVKKRIRYLLIPFFVWNSIFVLLHNIFIKINIYTDNPKILEYVSGTFIQTTERYTIRQVIIQLLKGVAFSTDEQLFGTAWFFKTLFLVSIAYCLIDFIIRKVFYKYTLVTQGIVSIILLAIGYYCSLYNISFMGLARVASVYCLYFVGHILGVNKEKYIHMDWKKVLPISLIAFGFLLWLNSITEISLSRNSYENPIILLVASMLGWIVLYGVAMLLKLIPVLKGILIYLGRETLIIVILHFLSFKCIELVVVYLYKLPLFCVAAFPNLYGEEGVWWIVYTLVGVVLPIAVLSLYRKVFEK